MKMYLYRCIVGLHQRAGELGQGVQNWLLYELESVDVMGQCVVMGYAGEGR